MIIINEWLPNPAGSDAENEWVELFNAGNATVNLSGWQVKNKSGQKYSLSGEIKSGEYLVLKRPSTKLTLVNQDGELYLYDSAGKLADKSVFRGTAQEGKSFAKNEEAFLFTDPTPGSANVFAETEILKSEYPLDANIAKSFGGASFLGMALGVGLIFTLAVIFVLKRSNDLSELFFGRY